jgi:plasmid stability protein
VKTRVRNRANRHGQDMERGTRDIPRDVKPEEEMPAPLGSRLRARFAGLELKENLAELCGYKARPARFGR